MTEPPIQAVSSDPRPPSRSPSDRPLKKTRPEDNGETADAMDLELPSKQLFPRDNSPQREKPTHPQEVISIPESDDDAASGDDDDTSFNHSNKPTDAARNKDDDDQSRQQDHQQAVDPETLRIAALRAATREKFAIATRLILHAPIQASTQLWSDDYNQTFPTLKSFLPTDISGKGKGSRGPNGLKNLMSTAKELMELPDIKTITTVWDWHFAFEIAFNDPSDKTPTIARVQSLAVRMARSDPVQVFPSEFWTGRELKESREVVKVWMAAYLRYGAVWKNRDFFHPQFPPLTKGSLTALVDREYNKPKGPLKQSPLAPTASSASAISKHVAFPTNTVTPSTAPDKQFKQTTPTKPPPKKGTPPSPSKTPPPSPIAPKPQVHPMTSMFLSKPLKAIINNPYSNNATKQLKDVSLKYRTYIKIKLAEVAADQPKDQVPEILACFQSIMDKIWARDAKAVALSWQNPSADAPLKQRTAFPSTRAQMVVYVDHLWVAKAKVAICRLLIAHEMDREKLFNDARLQGWIRESQLYLQVERIQSKEVVKIGHLMGYHADVANEADLADTIQLQPIMKGIPIEVRSEWIQLENKAERSARILQIYGSFGQAARARKALIKVYSSAADGKYPQGVQARFIPNIDDLRFIRNPPIVTAFNNSLKKHIMFMRTTKKFTTTNITQLDHVIGNTSLRQAIMHIRSSTNNWNLFSAVDTTIDGMGVTFAYRQDLEKEAKMMISALPLFLQETLASRKVWTWFTSNAEVDAAGYMWDMAKGCVVPINEEEFTDTNLEGWEHLNDWDEAADVNDGNVLHAFVLDLQTLGKSACSDSIKTAALGTQEWRQPTDEDNDDDDDDDDSMGQTTMHPPTDVSTQISAPSLTSTSTSTLTTTPDKLAFLTGLSTDPEKDDFLARMLDNPDMLKSIRGILAKTEQLSLLANQSSSGGKDDES